MPWDYSNLVGIHYTKGKRIFVFYDSKPPGDGSGSHYTGCYVDDGEEWAEAVITRLGKRLAPAWRPEGAGIQMELL